MKRVILWGLPDFCLGVYWAMLGTFIPWQIGLFPDKTVLLKLAFSSYAVTGVLTQLVVGRIIDKYQVSFATRSYLAYFGIILASISQIFWAKVDSGHMFLLFSILTFIGVNIFQSIYYSRMIENIEPENFSKLFGMSRSLNCLGGAFIGLISANLWANYNNLTIYIFTAFITSFPSIIAIKYFIKENKLRQNIGDKQSSNNGIDYKENLLRLSIIIFVMYCVSSIFIQLGNEFFVNNLLFTKKDFGRCIFFMNIGTLLFGLSANRIPPVLKSYKRVIVCALLILGAGFLCAFLINKSLPILLYLLYFIFGGCFVLVIITLYAILQIFAKNNSVGFPLSVINVACCIGQILGINLFTQFILWRKLYLIYLFCIIIIAVSCFVIIGIKKVKPSTAFEINLDSEVII